MRKNENIEFFKNWLNGFGVGRPSLHVNGASFNTAVVTVDFGSPLEQISLSNDQKHDLHSRMKELTSALTGRRNVRVQTDNNNGVHWTSI